jgi:PRTRC genetic system ThiF family protein
MKHLLHPSLLSKPVTIALVGAGGNGSQMLNGLARIHMSLKALGHPHGFEVCVVDPDVVTESNIGRQLFSPSDVGQPKASVLVNRLNLYYALNWKACVRKIGDVDRNPTDMIIGCVDNRLARRVISHWHGYGRYWLDLGNGNDTGQVILGEAKRYQNKEDPMRLPTVAELFPDMIDASKDKKSDNEPSCSLAGALKKQDLFINQTVSTFALNLLWQLFRNGGLDIHGYFINLNSGKVNALQIGDWRRFGIIPKLTAPLVKIKKWLSRPSGFNPGEAMLTCGHRVWTKANKRARCIECAKKGITKHA